MTKRNKIIPVIKIHPILILFIFISILTGTFIHLSIIFLIVLWHELGHYMMARYFNWEIQSIDLWIFGGVMKTDEHGTCHLREDFLVTIAGPAQHLLIFLILLLLDYFNIVPSSILQLAHNYNIIIFSFNLLPIYPLDGGKLLFYLTSIYFPFRSSYHFILILSLILPAIFIIIQLIYYPLTLSFILIMSFIIIENRIEWKNRMFIFRRFLLRRLSLSNYRRKVENLIVKQNELLIHVFSQFKRNRNYIIYVDHFNEVKKISEQACLTAFFYNKKLLKKIGDIYDQS